MYDSRTTNSALNIAINMICQFLVVILQFISRTIFIHYLGIEYLGLNGLFLSLVSLLSLAELGIGSAVTYSLYRPISYNDKVKLSGLIHYYKILYRRVALFVTLLGICVIPFLHILVTFDFPFEKIVCYYLMFLTNSILSYFFVYQTSITIADQKGYKLKIYNLLFIVIQNLLQICALILAKSYLLYIMVQVFCTIAVNVLCTRKTIQLYPFIKEKQEISDCEKKQIWVNIKSFFLYQIGGVLLNSTDNILISLLLGTLWVGYYSNYSQIVAQISGITSLVFVSMQASIGNLNVQCKKEKQYFTFNALNVLSFWIYGFCSVCVCVLIQDFIVLWLGESFLIDVLSVYMAVATFYLQGVLYPIWCYRQTTGLFQYTKYTMIFASIINLALSIYGGICFGLSGILAATVIARLVTNIWYDPYKLHQVFFQRSPKKYYMQQISNVILLIAIITVINYLTRFLYQPPSISTFIIKLFVCLILTNTIFFVWFRKREEFKFLLNKMSQILIPR